VDLPTLTESDICDQFITPAILAAGWDPESQVRREVTYTAGRIWVHGRLASRGKKRKRADYVLYYRAGIPLAVVEAKDANHTVGAGMQQALAYAEDMDAPFAISSNGAGFLIHDRTGAGDPVERELPLTGLPSPAELWARYCEWKGLDELGAKLAISQPFLDPEGKELRYFQRVAVQRTLEAIARGQRRLLLVMATGTGKTLTAFHLIWRLWKSGQAKRILFLVDRDAILGQTFRNDFAPFGKAMTRITNRQVDASYEIYLALYQSVTGTEEAQNIYRQFSPGFFDLVVVDECHRGSAREDSAWREILDYFDGAVHLGLTATPKETKDVSTQTYFGDPLFTYSLRQGIEDGFLAPYKVVRIGLDRDLLGWRPTAGQRDDEGKLIEDREFNQADMDRDLILTQRSQTVARRVLEYLRDVDPYGKTIVFCEDIAHAERMRSAFVNLLPGFLPAERGHESRFVVRMTGDSPEGTDRLDDFMDPGKRFPVIATTSKLLTTGVDTKPCKLIVLDQFIQSSIEFKQIVGRGSRIVDDAGKLWFTILDFRGATRKFADPNFDGLPEVIYEPGDGDPVSPPDPDGGGDPDDPDYPRGPDGNEGPGENGDPRTVYRVSSVTVKVIAERVQYLGPDGRLITESLRDYTRASVRRQFASLDAFLRHWSEADRKEAILQELREQGVLLEDLREQLGKDLDPFDLICHVVYDRPPLTRKERADQVRKRDIFTKYGPQAQVVLNALLDKYADAGIGSVEDGQILRLKPLSDLGTPVELVRSFGGKEQFDQAIRDLETALYTSTG
jgi:type I restriction enzyme R subunit